MKDNNLYALHTAEDHCEWVQTNVHGHPLTAFNFTHYIFKINDEIYTAATDEFVSAIAPLQTWEILQNDI